MSDSKKLPPRPYMNVYPTMALLDALVFLHPNSASAKAIADELKIRRVVDNG